MNTNLNMQPIKNSSAPNAVVMDLFGGSGSTLIACEQTDRMLSTKTAAQQFVSTLRSLPEKVTAFNPEAWGKLLDHVTVYADGTIGFTFRNGIEI